MVDNCCYLSNSLYLYLALIKQIVPNPFKFHPDNSMLNLGRVILNISQPKEVQHNCLLHSCKEVRADAPS